MLSGCLEYLDGCPELSVLGLISNVCPGHWVKEERCTRHGLTKSGVVASWKNFIFLWAFRTKSSIPEWPSLHSKEAEIFMRKGDLFTSWESYKDNLASYWVLILESPSVSSSLIPFLKPCFLLWPLSDSTYSKNFHSVLLSFTQSKLQKATILRKGNQLISNGKQRHESNKQIFATQRTPPPHPFCYSLNDSVIFPESEAWNLSYL